MIQCLSQVIGFYQTRQEKQVPIGVTPPMLHQTAQRGKQICRAHEWAYDTKPSACRSCKCSTMQEDCSSVGRGKNKGESEDN